MNVGEVFVRMALDDRDYKKGLARMEGFTQQKAMTLGSIFKGAFSFAIGIGVIQGFRSLGGAITDFVNTAARTEVLDVAMMAVARSTRHTTAEIREQEEALRDLGIAKQEAKQMLTRFMQAQIDVADVTKLARVAQDAAVIAGYNSSEAAQQMTEAIAKQRPELLTAFGFTRNLNDIYNDYAKTVGKTVKQLSEIEKKQAMVNYILKEGEKIAGTYEASMGAVGKIIGSLKRYWDDLKDAIAMPLALPAISVIVDGITNALKNAIGWAEANTMTLQMWGQTAADVASRVVEYFKWWYGVLIRNWQLIKVVTAALLAYATATKIAAAATTIFEIASSVLKGTIAANVPILGALSIAINTYRLQVALAPVATNIFTAALYRLQAAIYAVWTALGPVGWIILGISAAAGVGMHLWNKYTQSLQKGFVKPAAAIADQAKGFRELEASTKGAADATEDQVDALDKAGKAASKNLQSFDEIHQLQGDMAGSGEDMLDALDLDLDTDIPALDLEGMMAGIGGGLEGIKPTLKGFWEWIKQGFKNALEWIKEKTGLELWELLAMAAGPLGALVVLIARNWGKIKEVARTIWGGILDVVRTILGGFIKLNATVWREIWSLVSSVWGNMGELAKSVFGAIWGYITATWNNIKNATSAIWGAIWGFLSGQWGIIKTAAGNIWQAIGDLITGKIDLRTAVKTIWNEIAKFFSATWGNIRKTASTIWSAISKLLKDQWELSKKTASTIWTAIAKFFADTWNNIKITASNIWNAIKTFLSNTWNSIRQNATEIWNAIKRAMENPMRAARGALETITNSIRSSVSSAWQRTYSTISSLGSSIFNALTSPFRSAQSYISGIVSDAYYWGRNLIRNITDGITSRLSSVRSAVSNVASTVKSYLGFSSPTKEGPGRDADRWAPNLISMYAQGMLQNAGMVEGAVSAIAQQLSGLATTVTPSFADADVKLAPAFSGAGAGQGAGGAAPAGAGTGDIYVYIGNEQVDAYIYRAQDRRNIRSNGR